MARLILLSQICLVAIVFFTSQSCAAAASRSRRSAAFDLNKPELHLDERDQLTGEELYNKRGKLNENARIVITPRDHNHTEFVDRRTKQSKKRQSPAFNYGTTKVRGVNIGGWLVLEPWISIFDNIGDSRVVGEYTMGEYVSNAGEILEAHFNSFYKQSDFYDIADAGLNHVRIPIGFWAINKYNTPFYKGSQYSKLKAAVGWARNAGLKVVVDLHGVPGSQNGFDKESKPSGQRGVIDWFSQQKFANQAKEDIRRFAVDFRDDADVVTAIEFVNEPLTTTGPRNALSFYLDYLNNAYYTLRYPSGSNENSGVFGMAHTGFQALSYWYGKLQPPTYNNVILDTHIYSVFTNEEVAMSQSQRMSYYCNMKDSIKASNKNLYTIVGEFTSATTDCAKYLNGRGIGARYDGTYPNSNYVGSCKGKTGNGSTFSSQYKAQLKQSWDTQRKVYESGAGWIAWPWRAEDAADWSYKAGLKYGWITRNLNDFSAAAC